MGNTILITALGLTSSEQVILDSVIHLYNEQQAIAYVNTIEKANIIVTNTINNLTAFSNKTIIVLGHNATSYKNVHYIQKPLYGADLLKTLQYITPNDEEKSINCLFEYIRTQLHSNTQLNIISDKCALTLDLKEKSFYIKAHLNKAKQCVHYITQQPFDKIIIEPTNTKTIQKYYLSVEKQPIERFVWLASVGHKALLSNLSYEKHVFKLKRLADVANFYPESWQLTLMNHMVNKFTNIPTIYKHVKTSTQQIIQVINACYALNILEVHNKIVLQQRQNVVQKLRKRFGLLDSMPAM